MIDDPLAALAIITTAAVLCQWTSTRLKVPSALLLLVAGVSLSPVLDPDAIFGELLFVGVGIGVAILLFEGGAGLNWSKRQRGRSAVIRLVTSGALIAWVFGSIASATVLDIDLGLAILIGAILIVSGPTVVMPLLRVVRPREPAASILKWEGILIDPIGAGLAIVVLDAIISERSWVRIAGRVITTFGTGIAVGSVVAIVVLSLLGRHLIADHLHVPVTLAAVIGSYAAASAVRPEAGLIAVTLLGLAFANQKRVPASHIQDFNEKLGSTVIGVLFVVLGARVQIDDVVKYLPASVTISLVLVLVARPLTVLASTVGTEVPGRDRLLLMSLAPRGVVAAAVASLFAVELEHHDLDPGPLVPVVFTVVLITVALASTTARFWAHWFRVAQPAPKAVAIIGGGQFGFELADALAQLAASTLHLGLDEDEATEAAERCQLSYQGRLDSDELDQTIHSVGIACAVALSGTDHLDAYVTQRLSQLIGSANLFRVATARGVTDPNPDRGAPARLVLPAEVDADGLRALSEAGAHIRTVTGPQQATDDWATICLVATDRTVSFQHSAENAAATDAVIELDLRSIRKNAQ
jgi:NhaP-type Na+/H+ or K+/H+ antiporter